MDGILLSYRLRYLIGVEYKILVVFVSPKETANEIILGGMV